MLAAASKSIDMSKLLTGKGFLVLTGIVVVLNVLVWGVAEFMGGSTGIAVLFRLGGQLNSVCAIATSEPPE